MTMQTVLYSKLKAPDEINARESDGYDERGITELAALIATKGLLQPLVVRPAAKGSFEIIAGKRRYLAIGKLINDLQWPVGKEVPVSVRDDDDDEALETSLIENIGRKNMHPVQEFEIFHRIHSDGKHVREIAKQYGITELQVERSLALGALAPEIRAAWRAGELNRDAAEAFAVCRDPKQQAAGFKKLKKDAYNGVIQAHSVRHHFTKSKPKLSDSRLQFVGFDRYKEAGGKFVPSLFEDDGYIENEALLDKLLNVRVKEFCDEMIADGWAWACSEDDLKSGAKWTMNRVQGRKSYTAQAKARLKEIEAELEKAYNEDNDERSDRLEAEKTALEKAALLAGFSKTQKAESGVVITANFHGVNIEYGFIKDAPAAKAKTKAKAKSIDSDDDDTPAVEEPSISAALLSDIGGWQTAAVAQALAQCPQLAIQIAAAALTGSGFGYGSDWWPVRINCDGMNKYDDQRDVDPEDDETEEDDGAFDAGLPSKKGFATALASVPKDRAANVLAVNLGRALDLRKIKYKMVSDDDVAALVGAIPGAIYLKAMREKFDAEDYFKRSSAKIALSALDEMGVTVERNAKKPVLAAAAVEAAQEKGWLPEDLRHPDYALLGAKRKKAA